MATAVRAAGQSRQLGGIGVVLSSLGVLATVGGGPEFGPLWYPLSLVAVTLPCAWIGGRLAEGRQIRTESLPLPA